MALIGIPAISTGSFGAASMLHELGLPACSELAEVVGAAGQTPSTKQELAFIESWDESKSAKLFAKANEIYSDEEILSKLLALYSSS